MFCGECGQKVPDDSRFCEQCGRPIVIDRTQGAGPPAARPPDRGLIGTLLRGPAQASRSPEYARIVLWVKSRQGHRFGPGLDDATVQTQLGSILDQEKAWGVPPRLLKGFRAFIDGHQHETLLRRQR